MPVIQSTFAYQTFSMLPGQPMGGGNDSEITNKFARGLLRAGLAAFRAPVADRGSRNGVEPGDCWQIPSVPATAQASALGTAISSATGTKTFASGVTAGTYAAVDLQPARKLTVTFDSSTDWDPTTAVITYVNQLNQTVTENLAIATSTTATTSGVAKRFVSLAIPAQTGSGGTATLGVAAIIASITLADIVGVVVRQPAKTMVNPSNLYIGPTSDGVTNANTLAHYVDGDTVKLLQQGDLAVFTEEAIADNDPVYVRVSANGGNVLLGAFRNDADSASCVLVTGAKFRRTASAGVAWVHFGTAF